MKRKIFLFFLFISLFWRESNSLEEPPIPNLPDQFSCSLEANIIQRNLTLTLNEFYDFPGQRARYEFITAETDVVILEDYKSKIQYTIKGGNNCSQTSIQSPSDLVLPNGGMAVEELLRFGNGRNHTYAGVISVRGVPANCWDSSWSFFENTTSENTTHSLNLRFCFSQPSWGFRASGNITAKPMRAILEGNRTYSNGTVDILQHYYEFVNFVGGPPIEAWYEIPTACKGSNIIKQIQVITQQRVLVGLSIGMLMLGFFIGVIASAASWVVYSKHATAIRNQRMELAELTSN